MKIYIGAYRELCPNHQEFPSLMSCCAAGPYDGKKEIIDYLRKGGTEDMISFAIKKDVFSGEKLKGNDIGRSNDRYTWWTSLAHYVEKYNLQLPDEFVNYVLSQ